MKGWDGDGEAERTAGVIMLPLFRSHRDRRLVFLTAEEMAGLAQVNACSSEPSDNGLLERLFSSDISSVYRLGRRTAGIRLLGWGREKSALPYVSPFVSLRCFRLDPHVGN